MSLLNARVRLQNALYRAKLINRVDFSDLPLDFDAKAYLELNPDIAQIEVNPYQHYLLFGKSEKRSYKRETEIDFFAQLPVDFDAEEYRQLHSDLTHYTGNLETHYLHYGIREFRRYKDHLQPFILTSEKYSLLPKDFDHEVYLDLNPDLVRPDVNPYDHYIKFGVHEGRQFRHPDVIACLGEPADESKPTILLVSHEATRTGAPILTWNICRQFSARFNTVVLIMGGGSLLDNFQLDVNSTYLIPHAKQNQRSARSVVEELHRRHNFHFAILNSVETGHLCQPLTIAGVPHVLLVHEFAANTMPRDKFIDARIWAPIIVFSTELTKADAVAHFPGGIFDDTLVMPQGRCELPTALDSLPLHGFQPTSTTLTRGSSTTEERQLVLGIGSVCLRKGVDLFIEVATRMRQMDETNRLEFLWVGDGFTDYDSGYTAFLKAQILRAGLADCLTIAPETDDLASLYKRATLLLITSRLDPLPNVAIDAICIGLPLVCFDKASGIADLLTQNLLGEYCVSEYINTSDMARKAVKLLDSEQRLPIQTALKSIGESTFSMPTYCERLLSLHRAAYDKLTHDAQTVQVLLDSKLFDAAYYQGTALHSKDRQLVQTELCLGYVLRTQASAVTRKPRPGFNPLVYRERWTLPHNIEPLLHWAARPDHERGLPSNLITPNLSALDSTTGEGPKTALHIHCYYTDLLTDILDRLEYNRTAIDIYISVDSSHKREEVKGMLSARNLDNAEVSIHPNCGRDVYPFLALCESIGEHYDIIGHVHTKKSLHVPEGSDLVVRWRNLLLGNLLGSVNCGDMLDQIIWHMQKHPNLKIVFPDDPHIMGWGESLPVVQTLVSELDLSKIPVNFDFPIGTMFWARSSYLKSFIDMNLPQRFTPREPLAIDGTVLHAWERLLGARASMLPDSHSLTWVPGLSR